MPEAKLDQFFPMDLGWIAKAAQDWDAGDAPVFFVLVYMWPKAGRVPNIPEKLAKVAKVTPKAWARIRASLGTFFREEGGDLIQDKLVADYAEKSKVYLSNRTKTSSASNARWGKSRSVDASRIASSNASSIPSRNASRDASASVRASSCIDPDLDLKREEESTASAVPFFPNDPEITAAIQAFPRSRTLADGARVEVIVGESAPHLAAEFKTRNPDYPLLPAVRYSAAQGNRIRNFENWIADPPERSKVLSWWESEIIAAAEKERIRKGFAKPDPRELAMQVTDILAAAKENRSLVDA